MIFIAIEPHSARAMTTLRSMLRLGRRAGFATRVGASRSEVFPGVASSVSTTVTRGCLTSASTPVAVARRSSRSFDAFARSGASSRAFSAEGEKKDDADETEEATEAAEEGVPADEVTDMLKAELEEKDKQVKDMNDKLLRVLADMENLRERTRRQADQAEKFAIQGFVKDLLDVADNLGRALATVELGDETNDPAKTKAALVSMHEGVSMVEKQLAAAFAKHGVSKYDPTGDPFDPNHHMALFNVPLTEGEIQGTVAAVTKPGYKLHDRVIRPAEVGVFQA